MIDINNIIEKAYETVKSHSLGCGAYARWIWQDKDNKRKLGINEYGCADAVNILYTIGRFPSSETERAENINALKALQQKDTGLFVEGTHHSYHTTAHCIAALELFDAKADYPLDALKPILKKDNLINFLENLEWEDLPWYASHQGASIYAALVLQGEADMEWQNWYFAWLDENICPQTGLWRKGAWQSQKAPLLKHLVSTFHFMFNYEYRHLPMRYPDKLIDTCLKLYYEREGTTLGIKVAFEECDWVYCLNRALRQSYHRFDESKQAIYNFAVEYIDYIKTLDYENDDGFNDLHNLFGCLCGLAELQSALPGEIFSEKPLKLVLDRRPFI